MARKKKQTQPEQAPAPVVEAETPAVTEEKTE